MARTYEARLMRGEKPVAFISRVTKPFRLDVVVPRKYTLVGPFAATEVPSSENDRYVFVGVEADRTGVWVRYQWDGDKWEPIGPSEMAMAKPGRKP